MLIAVLFSLFSVFFFASAFIAQFLFKQLKTPKSKPMSLSFSFKKNPTSTIVYFGTEK